MMPRRDMMTYCGIHSTAELNSRQATITGKIQRIRSRYFARGKAAMEEITTCPTVAATATKRLLKAYRLKGTHSPDANLNSMEKLSSVGLRTKKRGGKI